MQNVDRIVKELFRKGYTQKVRLELDTKDASYTIDESEIFGLTIDRASVSGEGIELGNVTAAELTFTLKSKEGVWSDSKWSKVNFEGAEVFARLGIKKWDALSWEDNRMHWLPLGYFVVDNNPRHLNAITVQAMDRMVKFERVFEQMEALPLTVSQLISRACNVCGITCVTDVTKLPNADYIVNQFESDSEVTWRDILAWCCQLTGTNAMMNADGDLELKWYEHTDVKVSAKDRYDHDLYEQDVVITGIKYSTEEETFISGTDDYCFDLSDNVLITDNVDTVIENVYAAVGGTSYRPFSASIVPMPYLFPMDGITYVDGNGDTISTIITNMNYSMNGGQMAIAGKGETDQEHGYASGSGLTAKQREILEKLRKRMQDYVSKYDSAGLELNRLIGNSMGLNRFDVVQDDGSVKYYFGDGTTLEGSSVIYTFQANGFAWTSDWNNGNPVWEFGDTKDGSMIRRVITTSELNANNITAGTLQDSEGTFFLDLDNHLIRIGGIDPRDFFTETDEQLNEINSHFMYDPANGARIVTSSERVYLQLLSSLIRFVLNGNTVSEWDAVRNLFKAANGEFSNSFKIGNLLIIVKYDDSGNMRITGKRVDE